ncbi:hypothetical protein MHBO_001894 [Bonamia ostreae]|uniref:[phosphatase 2A protein]-leucine-carboxy methyltransferase n=1 Tax=Bonamia ostreae TaxID=126728 RepID=A0ABV2AKM0_9EUKA
MEENSRKLLEAIKNTANDALEAKQSCVETGYYRDDFLRHFTKGYQKRSPVINRGYYCRVKAVENILIKFCQNFEDRPKQVVSLGCGFDTTFFRLKHHHNIIFSNYIELDYKSIVSAKSEIIKNEKKLFSHLKNFKIKNGIKSDDYNLMSCDLSNIETIKKAFSEHKISYSAPTIFIAECVLIYMDSESSNNLIEWTTKSFSDEIVFVNYEQIHPGDCFSDMMIKNLAVLAKH